jgi:hypothetical protein
MLNSAIQIAEQYKHQVGVACIFEMNNRDVLNSRTQNRQVQKDPQRETVVAHSWQYFHQKIR